MHEGLSRRSAPAASRRSCVSHVPRVPRAPPCRLARRFIALPSTEISFAAGLDGEADNDFAFMAAAHHFVRSGGGYSSLIAQLVERQGGRVYPGLAQSEWLEPRAVLMAKRTRQGARTVSFYPPGAS